MLVASLVVLSVLSIVPVSNASADPDADVTDTLDILEQLLIQEGYSKNYRSDDTVAYYDDRGNRYSFWVQKKWDSVESPEYYYNEDRGIPMTDRAYWQFDDLILWDSVEKIPEGAYVEIEFLAPAPDGGYTSIFFDLYGGTSDRAWTVSEMAFDTLLATAIENGYISDGSVTTTASPTATVVPVACPISFDAETNARIAEAERAGQVANADPVAPEDLDADDVENVLDVVYTYGLPAADRADLVQRTGETDLLLANVKQNIEPLEAIDTSGEQEVESNRGRIMEAFEDDLTISDGEITPRAEGLTYEGEDRMLEKSTLVLSQESVSKADKSYIKKLKVLHDAARIFAPAAGMTLAETKVFDIYGRGKQVLDGMASVKKIRNELKGQGGDVAIALYALGEAGKEVSKKVPGGKAIEKGCQVVQKIVMVLPDLARDIKDSRAGITGATSFGGTSINSFYDKYADSEYVTRTETDNGPIYSFTYTDENGEKQTISPDYWKTVVSNGKRYQIPYEDLADIPDNPVGDVALQDVDGGSLKVWKWDNVKFVKRSNPAIGYYDGREFDL